jgi:hypothetical protein
MGKELNILLMPVCIEIWKRFHFQSFGADGEVAEAWLENMEMCFALRDYTQNIKVRMGILQQKGSALLWWNTLLP